MEIGWNIFALGAGPLVRVPCHQTEESWKALHGGSESGCIVDTQQNWHGSKTMEDYGRLWKTMEDYGRLWKTMEGYERMKPSYIYSYIKVILYKFNLVYWIQPVDLQPQKMEIEK